MSNVKKAAASRLDDLSTSQSRGSIVVKAVRPPAEAISSQAGEAAQTSADERLNRLLAQVNRIVSLPLNELVIEENVRQEVDIESTEFAELVNSIKETGLMQNLIVEVRPGEGTEYKLVCVSGQRRLLAARQAGVEKTYVLLKQFDSDAERVIAGLAENMLRKGLHAFDIADGYRRLLVAGWGQAQICEYFDRDRKHVQRYLKLAEYPEEIKRKARDYPAIFSARVLLNDFAAKSFTTEKLGEAVEKRIAATTVQGRGTVGKKISKKAHSQTAYEKKQSQKYSKKLSLQIKWRGSEEQGAVSIHYRNADELERLLAKLN